MRKYIFLMWVMSLVPSIFLSVLIELSGIFEELPGPKIIESHDFGKPLLAMMAIVVVGPFIETLMLSFGIFMLSRFIRAKIAIAILSGIFWGIMHSLIAPVWGLIVWWPFIIFSCAYLTWRQRSWLHAVWVAFCIHVLQNLLPGLAVTISLSM